MNEDQRVDALWCETLDLDSDDDEATFFEQGGDSLLAIKMLFHIERELQVTITYGEFALTPTRAWLRDLVRRRRGLPA
jgi:acyl carrier protein